MDFTADEKMLLMLYGSYTREETITGLQAMYSYLQEDERELAHLTNSVISKVKKMSDQEFEIIDVYAEWEV